jgi:hypothetical protein
MYVNEKQLSIVKFFIARTITRMGRPQKHTDHPLYKLRVLLSKDANRAITQPELSRIVGVPLPTLQSIESRRRGWTEEVQRKISQAIWALWDDNKERWMFKHSSPPKEFSYSLFERYRGFIHKGAPIPETDPEAIKMRVDVLFEQIPEESWMKLYWRLQDCLEECRQDFELKNAEDVFEATMDKINFTPARFERGEKAWTAEPINRTFKFPPQKLEDYLRDYYKRCAKHYGALSRRTTPPKTRSNTFRLDALD